MMIWLSGDVALNPGPVKNPCGFCHRAVASNHRAVLCEACYNWYHIKCAGIFPNYYTELANSEDPWLNRTRWDFSKITKILKTLSHKTNYSYGQLKF